MVTDVNNARQSRPVPISQSGESYSFLNAPPDVARRVRYNLRLIWFAASMAIAALLYVIFTRGMKPVDVERALTVSAMSRLEPARPDV